MSSEIRINGLTTTIPGPSGGLDQVVATANDRPHPTSLPSLADPAADHADEALLARRADVEEKQRRMAEFLDATGYDALVLARADSISWFTSGADLGQGLATDSGTVLLYINRIARAILADNVQSVRAFEEEVAGLGFQLKERPWHDDGPGRIIDDLGHGKTLASDNGLHGLPDELERLRPWRLELTTLERHRLRILGRTVSLAIEATCRNIEPGETEADVAGQLAHRLIREGVVPVELRVAGDDRLARYREPTFKAALIRGRAAITVTGRRHGLCASATRIVSFGPVDPRAREAQGLAAMVDASCIYFSRPGEPVSEVFRRAQRIYEKFGHPDEWTLAYQGFLTGYSPREVHLRAEESLILKPFNTLRWCPSVGPTRSEDTIIIDNRGYEIVTEAQDWPMQEVMVKGFTLTRPAILER